MRIHAFACAWKKQNATNAKVTHAILPIFCDKKKPFDNRGQIEAIDFCYFKLGMVKKIKIL